jgi:hypothetical protein
VGGNRGMKRDHRLFDFALAGQAELVRLHPGFAFRFPRGPRQMPQCYTDP